MSIFYSPAIPTSSDYTIIIPFHPSKGKFDRTVYSPAMAGGRVSSEAVDKILSFLDTLAEGLSVPDITRAWCVRFLLPFLFMLFLQINHFFIHSQGIAWFFFLTYVLLGSFWMYISQCNQSEKVMEEVKRIFELYGEPFKEKGLRWHVPESFPCWVEIYKDYREKQFVDAEEKENENKQVIIQMTEITESGVESQGDSIDKPLLQK